MKRLSWWLPATALCLMVTFLSGCSDDDGDPTASISPVLLTGPAVTVGDGQAWTEVTYDPDGAPTGVYVVMTPGALDNLPDGHLPSHEFTLPLPDGADVAPYDHATLDWNAHGHAPPGVYDVPHFDVHFYFMSAAERDLIGPNDTTEFNRPLPATQLAEMYLETPGGAPRMGAHVIDLQSPEVNGSGPFTHTYIYGKYNGQLTFIEPMVAESFLRSQPDIEVPIRQPAEFPEAGYYPESYVVAYDASTDTYRIGLHDLNFR